MVLIVAHSCVHLDIGLVSAIMLRLALVAIAGALHASALNFYVEPSTVNECGQTKVEFTKGTPPYQITAIVCPGVRATTLTPGCLQHHSKLYCPRHIIE